jgi:hypothetical protein
LLILGVLQVNNSLLSDLTDTDITNCHIVSNAYLGTTTPPLLRAANTTVFIHSVLANKFSLTLKVTGKVTDSDTVLVFSWCILSPNACHYGIMSLLRAPDKLRICVFYAMKMSKNACIIRSECTHYAYILLCKQTFQIRSVLVHLCT